MFKGYRPDRRGLAEIAKDPRLGAVCESVARQGAAIANQLDPDGNYQASPRMVTAGWKNESRRGAVIQQTGKSWTAERDRVLVEVTRRLRGR
ncbi:hypothetical protein [Nesterenkonia rhizosphaerae]|uniref:HK97 gp10 family phage protein n=1 Tax=Nesterenkonia rhizosphaerae TaxID=1348272 RepID=A0ABP9G2Y4_9MICC